MSLSTAMFTGVSGLLNNAQAMNVIGNNISNVNTIGYKEGRTEFSDLLSQNAGGGNQVGTGMQMQAVQNIFTQGTSQASANVTDLSIQGNSFFALKAPTAASPVASPSAALLSRAGAFTVDKSGVLVNPDGYQVLDTAGNPVTFQVNTGAPTTDFSKVVSVGTDGLITYLATDGVTQNYYNTSGGPGVTVNAANAATVQRLAVVNVPDATALTKAGGSLYQANDASGVSTAAFSLTGNQPNGTSEQVVSNTLEASNVDMASEFVNMIVTQRAYSANSKTITTTDQMTQEVLGLIR